jgi:hypothetical protein
MFPSGQPVHDLIEGLRVGTLLRLVQRRRYTMLVVAEGGAPVGRLSKEARTLWLDRDVEQVRVTAVLERTKEQSETKYQDRCRVERWGVVIAEGVWRV